MIFCRLYHKFIKITMLLATALLLLKYCADTVKRSSSKENYKKKSRQALIESRSALIFLAEKKDSNPRTLLQVPGFPKE